MKYWWHTLRIKPICARHPAMIANNDNNGNRNELRVFRVEHGRCVTCSLRMVLGARSFEWFTSEYIVGAFRSKRSLVLLFIGAKHLRWTNYMSLAILIQNRCHLDFSFRQRAPVLLKRWSTKISWNILSHPEIHSFAKIRQWAPSPAQDLIGTNYLKSKSR